MATRTHVLRSLPEELTKRGFILHRCEDDICELILRRTYDAPTKESNRTAPELIIWSFDDTDVDLIHVTVDDSDSGVVIATSFELADLLPTIDGLIAILSSAPFATKDEELRNCKDYSARTSFNAATRQ